MFAGVAVLVVTDLKKVLWNSAPQLFLLTYPYIHKKIKPWIPPSEFLQVNFIKYCTRLKFCLQFKIVTYLLEYTYSRLWTPTSGNLDFDLSLIVTQKWTSAIIYLLANYDVTSINITITITLIFVDPFDRYSWMKINHSKHYKKYYL